MTIDYNFELGGFPGIFCELLWIQPDEIVVRYHPDMNEDFELEFAKRYPDGNAARESLATFIQTVPVTKPRSAEELRSREWSAYEREVNASVIALIDAFLRNEIPLPDGGQGFRDKNADKSFLQGYVDQWNKGEYIQFVDFSRYGK